MFADFCLGLFANKCTVTFWCRGTWKILCLVVRSLKGVKNSIPFNLLFFLHRLIYQVFITHLQNTTLLCDWCCRDLCIYLIWFISSFIVLHAKKVLHKKIYKLSQNKKFIINTVHWLATTPTFIRLGRVRLLFKFHSLFIYGKEVDKNQLMRCYWFKKKNKCLFSFLVLLCIDVWFSLICSLELDSYYLQ